jgi:hypothetical protein
MVFANLNAGNLTDNTTTEQDCAIGQRCFFGIRAGKSTIMPILESEVESAVRSATSCSRTCSLAKLRARLTPKATSARQPALTVVNTAADPRSSRTGKNHGQSLLNRRAKSRPRRKFVEKEGAVALGESYRRLPWNMGDVTRQKAT